MGHVKMGHDVGCGDETYHAFLKAVNEIKYSLMVQLRKDIC